MASSSQSTPTVAANIGGTNHQVNLRDYLNIRVAPFIKKAVTESLDASPEFPLQWLGEHLIHQSMLYEGNPDKTNIKERFVHKFDTPVAAPAGPSAQPHADSRSMDTTTDPTAESVSEPMPSTDQWRNVATDSGFATDAQMSSHINGDSENGQVQHEDESRDTEMDGTS